MWNIKESLIVRSKILSHLCIILVHPIKYDHICFCFFKIYNLLMHLREVMKSAKELVYPCWFWLFSKMDFHPIYRRYLLYSIAIHWLAAAFGFPIEAGSHYTYSVRQVTLSSPMDRAPSMNILFARFAFQSLHGFCSIHACNFLELILSLVYSNYRYHWYSQFWLHFISYSAFLSHRFLGDSQSLAGWVVRKAQAYAGVVCGEMWERWPYTSSSSYSSEEAEVEVLPVVI